LEGAHVCEDFGGAGEAILGSDFCGFGCCGSGIGAGFGVSLGISGTGASPEDIACVEGDWRSECHGGEQGCGDGRPEAVVACQMVKRPEAMAW
jgi:hypothetical protein